MTRASRSVRRAGSRLGGIPFPPERGVAAGYLAMLPLLLAYEVSARGPMRSVAELVLSLPLAPLATSIPGAARTIRIVILAVLALIAVARLHRRSAGRDAPGLLPLLFRIALEGALAALCLGPLLLLLLWILGVERVSGDFGLEQAAASPPPLETAAFLAGGAAWEEILYRIGIQSLAFLAAARLLRFLTASELIERVGAEVVSLGATGAAFAASHLFVFTQVFGGGGETFEPGVFTWRLLAGILLGALFRWRGPGVSAWAHALFDLGLAIGAGPYVFL